MSLNHSHAFGGLRHLWVLVLLSIAAGASDRPNIVLIISDDQAWNDYGFMGHEAIATPHLDQLAQESVLFRRGYVPTALCRPSLATMATGRYVHQHGITGNDPSNQIAPRDSEAYKGLRAQVIDNIDRFPTLADRLGEIGYLSHQSGKWWEGGFHRGGFTHGMTRGFPQPGGRHGDDGLAIGREGLTEIENFLDLSLAEEKPFFLWYAPFLPHTPHNPPERLLQKYQKADRPVPIAKYYAMCEWFDETCGELRAALEKRGVADNTLIAYVTDNGWIQKPTGNGYAPRSKQTANEGGVRTPIFFHWPAQLDAADRTELVSSIDLYPTLLAAAGIDTDGEELPGMNLWSHLQEGAAIERNQIFGEGFAHDIADLDNPQASLLYRWTIRDQWKLLLTYDGTVNRYQSTHPRTERRPQLFDLARDPWEESNLAEDRPELVAELAKDIRVWWPADEREVLEAF